MNAPHAEKRKKSGGVSALGASTIPETSSPHRGVEENGISAGCINIRLNIQNKEDDANPGDRIFWT